MQLRHMGDYQQPGVRQRQAERAVRLAREFLELLVREVFNQEIPRSLLRGYLVKGRV
jgi:hypothetical protein